MDIKILVENLNDVFCNNNKTSGKKYSEVWLSEVDFGGLYNNGMFLLCVKAEHEIDSCSSEITDIVNLLDKEANEELKYIWSVRVYNIDNQIHCEREDIQVFNIADAC
jgi:hypothetical protein